MALLTHPHFQGSYVSLPSRPSSPGRRFTLKRCVVKVHVLAIGKGDRYFSPKRQSSLRLWAPCSSLLLPKSLRISSFKGTAHNDDSSAKTHGCQVSSNSLNLSYVSTDGDGNVMGSPKAHDVPVSYTSEANSVANSPAFQKLFRKWLSVLRTLFRTANG
ncbi:hypothetical protein MLD38_039432 [Melastoma candidum]|uniref:Uncharacterized protein n=1 Tax=Melastoma candidum TaxID=119954 RepID=A0ACB9L226_9MYRT|nr:hypothetical protein MLD38_039432 [Melastoma candidum]